MAAPSSLSSAFCAEFRVGLYGAKASADYDFKRTFCRLIRLREEPSFRLSADFLHRVLDAGSSKGERFFTKLYRPESRCRGAAQLYLLIHFEVSVPWVFCALLQI